VYVYSCTRTVHVQHINLCVVTRPVEPEDLYAVDCGATERRDVA